MVFCRHSASLWRPDGEDAVGRLSHNPKPGTASVLASPDSRESQEIFGLARTLADPNGQSWCGLWNTSLPAIALPIIAFLSRACTGGHDAQAGYYPVGDSPQKPLFAERIELGVQLFQAKA